MFDQRHPSPSSAPSPAPADEEAAAAAASGLHLQLAESAEIHQAEGPPLLWSEKERRYVTVDQYHREHPSHHHDHREHEHQQQQQQQDHHHHHLFHPGTTPVDRQPAASAGNLDSAGAPTGSRGGRVADELEEHGGTTTCNTSEAKVEGGQHSTTSTSSSSLDPGDPNEPIYVTFDDDDPDNPFDWSRRRKWTLTLIGSWLTTLVAIAGPGFVMGIEDMQRDLGVSHFVASLAYGLYPLGFGIGPLVLAPISEVYGRNPMYRWSTVAFTLLYLPLALAPNIALICVFRLLSGIAGSVGSTMVGGTIADIWVARERGKPMSIFSIGAFAGTGLGPAMFGYVAQNAGWRWIQWIQMMMAGVTSVVCFIFFRETRGSVILSRRAAKLRKETGSERYKCRADEERASLAILIKVGISRPLWFLISEPIVSSLSIWIGFSWGCLMGLVPAISLVYMNVYGWRIGATGLAFIPVTMGALVGWQGNRIQEKLYAKYHPKVGMEARLYGAMAGGLIFAIGSMIFAWAIKGHWVGPLFGIGILFTGVYNIYQAVFIYLAEAYTVYASSAMSAQSFARNLMGFVFPLFITQMYTNLGYSWAAFLCAMIAFALSVIPFVLFRYGKTIRAHSPAAIELARQLEEAERAREARMAARAEKKDGPNVTSAIRGATSPAKGQ